MAEIRNWMVEQLEFPEDCNVILGQSHFIKTVEDIYEALVTSSPALEFGIAFCEASGPCLIRHDGNKEDLVETAVKNAEKVSAGHFFIVVLRKGYPINVMDRIKGVQEVCRIFAATANPLQVLIAETDQGRGVVGVVDGFPSKGVESPVDIEERKNLLRNIIGYKR
jgi:adenosine/AMP kinase